MHVRGTSAHSRGSPALNWPDTAKNIKRKGPEQESGDTPVGNVGKKVIKHLI